MLIIKNTLKRNSTVFQTNRELLGGVKQPWGKLELTLELLTELVK